MLVHPILKAHSTSFSLAHFFPPRRTLQDRNGALRRHHRPPAMASQDAISVKWCLRHHFKGTKAPLIRSNGATPPPCSRTSISCPGKQVYRTRRKFLCGSWKKVFAHFCSFWGDFEGSGVPPEWGDRPPHGVCLDGTMPSETFCHSYRPKVMSSAKISFSLNVKERGHMLQPWVSIWW